MFDLPPVIMDDTPVKGAPNTHTTIFNPIGKYATDVQYQLVRIPIHFAPIERAQEDLNIFMHNAQCHNRQSFFKKIEMFFRPFFICSLF